ncbi:MAG: hypothetical protein ASARMPRED_001692 [Alectoria sarmentosa]|nr:MAG: hypothetical protein ASARMPRED_001692 [Alectoria sarmentosa]
MGPSPQTQGENSSDLFRPSKRRKFYRKRTDAENEGSPAISSPPESMTVDELISHEGRLTQPPDQKSDEESLPVAEILRQRKAALRRTGGIEFTNSYASASNRPQTNDALIVKEDDTPADIKSVIERFAPQTGQVSDVVDKHMYAFPPPALKINLDAATNVIRMAYIDSELAKRQRQNQSTSTQSLNGQELSPNGALLDAGLHRQPAALGKLHEIDLGPDATLRNIALTKAAQRKLEGIEPEIDESTGKVRLRKDGKPWRPRKRRNSEDVKRDKLVEEVMRESRLDIYDEPDEEVNNDDQAADDRIAEQFRREFMDAISSRQQKAAQAKKSVKGKEVDDQPRGPKLGGSRSARAAMREREEAAKKKK